MATKSTTRKSTPAGRKTTRTRSTTGTASKTTRTGSSKSAPKLKAVDTTPAKADEAKTAPVATAAAAPADTTDRARRPDLIEAIAQRTSLKRSDVKVVMDLALEEIGKLLDDHDEAALAPLGKLMVKKRVPNPKGDVLTLKLKRTGKPQGDGAAGKPDDRADGGA